MARRVSTNKITELRLKLSNEELEMELHFPDGVEPAIATEVVRNAMADVEISDDFLTAVIVADDFAGAVARVLGRPDPPMDNIEFGGKAIPALGDTGVRTTVLLPDGPFRRLLDEKSRNGDRLTDVARMTRLSLRHELGHAKDYRLRGVTGHHELNKNLPFRLAAIEEHELEMVLQEFLACAHSGRAMTQTDFNLIEANEHRLTQYFRRAMRENFWAFLSEGYEGEFPKRVFKYDMALGYWALIASSAKVFGYMILNGGLRMSGSIWESPGPESGLFDSIRDLLRHQWEHYPRLDEGANREIIRCWHELMRVDGAMSFEVQGDEDAMEKQVSEELEQKWGRPLARTMRF